MSPSVEFVELLAPAGSWESLIAALNAGCDAVYFGVVHLNMRARSSQNFTLDDFGRISSIVHERKKKCYLTLNTIIYDDEVDQVRNILRRAKEMSIDAVIASDISVIMLARELGIVVHISTQASISNIEAVKFYASYSDRIVLARELTLPMISKISKAIECEDIRGPSGHLIELEAFAHGAICVAISGRCGMSLYTDNLSANRGMCRQICRREYKVTDISTGKELVVDNAYVMSPEDLCTVGFLDRMFSAGIRSFKIEGRGRSPEYVDLVVRVYREALDSLRSGGYTSSNIQRWNEKLKTEYNRGLSSGFYLGSPIHSWSGAYGSKATRYKSYVGYIRHYYTRIKVVELFIESSTLIVGDEYSISGPTTGVVRGVVEEILCDKEKICKATKGMLVTFKVSGKVREKDKLYVVKARG